jgi:hypothetical protein
MDFRPRHLSWRDAIPVGQLLKSHIKFSLLPIGEKTRPLPMTLRITNQRLIRSLKMSPTGTAALQKGYDLGNLPCTKWGIAKSVNYKVRVITKRKSCILL